MDEDKVIARSRRYASACLVMLVYFLFGVGWVTSVT